MLNDVVNIVYSIQSGIIDKLRSKNGKLWRITISYSWIPKIDEKLILTFPIEPVAAAEPADPFGKNEFYWLGYYIRYDWEPSLSLKFWDKSWKIVALYSDAKRGKPAFTKSYILPI